MSTMFAFLCKSNRSGTSGVPEHVLWHTAVLAAMTASFFYKNNFREVVERCWSR